MQLGLAEIQTNKLLLGLYVFSLAFFDKAIFFGYDSPCVYVGMICVLAVVFSKKTGIVLPNAVIFWLLFLFAILLSSYLAISYDKILSSTARLISIIIISVGIYNILRSYRYSIKDTLNFYLALSILLSIVGMLQFIEFNIFHTFNLYFPPTNLQFVASGGPGALTGPLAIFRATGTFAEPSWLAYYLIPALILSITRYMQTSIITNLTSALIILGGLISTLSVAGLILFVFIILILFFIKILFVLLHMRLFPSHFIRLACFGIIMILIVNITGFLMPISESYINNRIDEITYGLDPSSNVRISTANQAVLLFELSPILGIGAGNYPFAASLFLGDPADVSINSGFLLILAETGIIGFVAFGLVLWRSFRPILRISSPLGEQLIWLLLCDSLLLISYNWWYHPLLWLHLTIPLAINNEL
jgi:hypothetical protein